MAIIKTVNWEGGSNARYDLSQMTPDERAMFDGEGRPLAGGIPGDGPDQWTDGLPGARGGDSQYSMGGGGGGGGNAMASNPYFQQYQASLQADQAADLTDTKSQLQQLLIAFGLVPEGYKDSLGALDDTIRSLINQNTSSGISQYSRLLENKGDVQRDTIGRLASRGLSRSGAKGYRLRRNQLDFDRTFSDQLQGLLGQTGGLQSGYAGRERQRQMNLTQFLAQIFQNYYRGSGGGGGGGGRSVPAIPSYTPAPAPAWTPEANPWNDWSGNTIGGGETQGGTGTAYGPAVGTSSGGYTSPKKPLLMY